METKTKQQLNVYAMTRIALFTALTCILAPMSIPIPISPVPISLTNFVIFLSVYILDRRSALISYVLYLLLGIAGLPVFSGYSGGPAKLAGPTGGYLIGFIILIIIGGIFAERAHKSGKISLYIAGIVIGEAVMYVVGTMWLINQMGITFIQGLFAGVIPYIPGDIVKLVIAVIIAPKIRERIRGL